VGGPRGRVVAKRSPYERIGLLVGIAVVIIVNLTCEDGRDSILLCEVYSSTAISPRSVSSAALVTERFGKVEGRSPKRYLPSSPVTLRGAEPEDERARKTYEGIFVPPAGQHIGSSPISIDTSLTGSTGAFIRDANVPVIYLNGGAALIPREAYERLLPYVRQ
jgi:hypothetical protein